MPTIDLGRVKGQDGRAATIQVGTVRTGAAGSAASVANSGTDNAAVFDFVIPKGDNGFGAIPDDSVSGKQYTVGVSNGKMYMEDNATPAVQTKIALLKVKHTWTETVEV